MTSLKYYIKTFHGTVFTVKCVGCTKVISNGQTQVVDVKTKQSFCSEKCYEDKSFDALMLTNNLLNTMF